VPFNTAKGYLVRAQSQIRSARRMTAGRSNQTLNSRAHAHPKMHRVWSRPPVAVSLGETVLWGGRNALGALTLSRFGNHSAAYPSGFPSIQAFQLVPTSALWKTTADPAFAITGSVKFTLAVIELSRICSGSAIGNRSLAVRKLWSVEIPCGRGRKTRHKFRIVSA